MSRINDAIEKNGVLSQRDVDNNLKLYQAMVDGQERMIMLSEERIQAIREQQYKNYNRMTKKEREKIDKQIVDAEARRLENEYKIKTALEKKSFLQQQQNNAEVNKKRLEMLQKEYEKQHKNTDAITKKIEHLTKIEEDSKKRIQKINDIEYKNLSLKDKIATNARNQEQKWLEAKQKYLDAQLAVEEAKTEEAKKQAKEEEESAKKEQQKAARRMSVANVMQNAAKFASGVAEQSLTAVESAMKDSLSYQTSISTRLGLDTKGYSALRSRITGATALSPYVTTQNTMANLSKMVETGISYNVELRAFLATVSDKIANTFDAFDSNMLRLIRLQQADTTASRLGMESVLTRMLTNVYQDSSYMNNAYDTVAGALLDASAQMTRDQAIEFEYSAQKWLGSLYALGLSDSAVGSIASGLNALGTGNVESLTSSGIGSLFAIASSRGGLSYGDILSRGLNAETTNLLLKNVVQYLKDIANSTDSMVQKTALGNIFGVGISDLRAIGNLTNADISGIYKNGLTYDQSMKQLSNSLSTIGERMNIGEMIQNVFSNAMYGIGANIASNPIMYATWLATQQMKNMTGGTPVPSVMGTSIGGTVEGWMQLALLGGGIIGSIADIANAGGNLSGTDLSSWKWAEYTSRGTDFSGVAEGLRKGLSMSATIASSGQDIQSQTLEKAKEDLIQEGVMQQDKDFGDLYDALFGGESGERMPILVEIRGMENGTPLSVKIEESELNPITVRSAY